jgi:outer membrane murein-binding lipoprotein Lpp
MICTAPRRTGRLVAAVMLGLAVLAGCSSDGGEVDCSVTACTLTFDRGVEAKVDVLGVTVELVGAQDGQATLAIAGTRVTLPVDQTTEVAGMSVTVTSVTAEQVVVRMTAQPE